MIKKKSERCLRQCVKACLDILQEAGHQKREMVDSLLRCSNFLCNVSHIYYRSCQNVLDVSIADLQKKVGGFSRVVRHTWSANKKEEEKNMQLLGMYACNHSFEDCFENEYFVDTDFLRKKMFDVVIGQTDLPIEIAPDLAYKDILSGMISELDESMFGTLVEGFGIVKAYFEGWLKTLIDTHQRIKDFLEKWNSQWGENSLSQACDYREFDDWQKQMIQELMPNIANTCTMLETSLCDENKGVSEKMKAFIPPEVKESILRKFELWQL